MPLILTKKHKVHSSFFLSSFTPIFSSSSPMNSWSRSACDQQNNMAEMSMSARSKRSWEDQDWESELDGTSRGKGERTCRPAWRVRMWICQILVWSVSWSLWWMWTQHTHTDPCISYFFSSKCYVRLSNFTFAIQFPQIHVAWFTDWEPTVPGTLLKGGSKVTGKTRGFYTF